MEKSNTKFHTKLPKTELSKQFWEENIKVGKLHILIAHML